jgi:hypothetical protein
MGNDRTRTAESAKIKGERALSVASDFHKHGWNMVNRRCMLRLKEGSIARYSGAGGFFVAERLKGIR